MQEYWLHGHQSKDFDDGRRRSQVRRAVFDNQGRASWEWQTATGVFETNVSHEQLQTLEAPELSLVENEPVAAHGRVWTQCVAPRRAARERRRGSP